MTDTHTHLYMADAYPDGCVQAVERAIAAGVTHLVFPGVDMDSQTPMRELHERFPHNTHIALGLHPTELGENWEDTLDRMEAMLPGDFSAIGEVGIDLYHDSSMRAAQKKALARQLGWARQYGLPVIIHCREGLDDTIDIIKESGDDLPPLIFHSFTGTVDDVRRIREVCDPWFGINGVVTFKNAPLLREALPEIGIDRILLETDSPWLSPAPRRGERNESARIPLIRDCVAATLGITAEEVEKTTDRSAARLFGFTDIPIAGSPGPVSATP